MTEIKGIVFDEAFNNIEVFDNNCIRIPYLSLEHLIQAKKASGGFKDLDDIDQSSKE